jgi:hypothetical protein
VGKWVYLSSEEGDVKRISLQFAVGTTRDSEMGPYIIGFISLVNPYILWIGP